MAYDEAISLRHHFADLIDPRGERSRRHELLDIIGIAICAVISGAESWTAVEAYGHAKHDWLPSRCSPCPTASPRTTPSAGSSACSTPRRSSGASPTGSRRWPTAAWGR